MERWRLLSAHAKVINGKATIPPHASHIKTASPPVIPELVGRGDPEYAKPAARIRTQRQLKKTAAEK